MFRSLRRCTLTFTMLAVVAVAPMAVASTAFAAPDRAHAQSSDPVLATLKVTTAKVEVKKDGADKFEAAADGDKLRQGDTVRTDSSGTAEVDYSDDSYTRLDVNTTFKIKKLTDDQGARQVQGSLEVGQTWNRTAAITESGSFEQEGAGANATVLGTAFSLFCDTPDHCVFTAVVDAFNLAGTDGTAKLLSPLDECDAASGAICPEVKKITVSELPSWVITNLKLDLSERGINDSGFLPTAAVAADSPTLILEQESVGSVIDGCSLSITGLIAPGSDVTLHGSLFDPTETLPVSLNGTVVQEVTTDAAGSFTSPLSIPGDTTFPITISVPCGPGSTSVASATASLDPGSSTALAFTGSDSSPLVAGGIVALALGAILVVAARRRAGARAI